MSDWWCGDFKPGDIVRFKLGGPRMSIHRIVSPVAAMHTGHLTGVHCDWIDKTDRPHRAVYAANQLEPAP